MLYCFGLHGFARKRMLGESAKLVPAIHDGWGLTQQPQSCPLTRFQEKMTIFRGKSMVGLSILLLLSVGLLIFDSAHSPVTIACIATLLHCYASCVALSLRFSCSGIQSK